VILFPDAHPQNFRCLTIPQGVNQKAGNRFSAGTDDGWIGLEQFPENRQGILGKKFL
jgi:hypothetical protein